MPPSASTVWPVTNRDWSEVRNMIRPTRSSAVASRPSGVDAIVTSTTSSKSGNARATSPSISVHDAVLTRMFSGANSTARYRVSDSSAAFDVPTTT